VREIFLERGATRKKYCSDGLDWSNNAPNIAFSTAATKEFKGYIYSSRLWNVSAAHFSKYHKINSPATSSHRIINYAFVARR